MCLYRRLPARTVEGVLGLDTILTPERQIDAASLPDFQMDEELPLEELSAKNPGNFECRADTLTWRPSSAYEPSVSTVVLLDQHGKPLPCRLSSIPAETGTAHYQIEDAPDRPAFAQVQHGETTSVPAIVTLIDRLRATTRETSSRQTDKALRELDNETEATLLLLDVLNVLERMDQDDSVSKDSLSIPKTRKHEDEGQREHRVLSYDEFIAGRRQRNGIQSAHNSLAGSDVSLVRGFLNRIVGLAANGSDEEDDDSNVPGSAFDMRDETDNAEGALASGEEFDTAKKRREEEERAKEERRRAAARKATKEQIVGAVKAFRERIRQRKESGAIDNQDILRLRALLMIICTAACPPSSGTAKQPQCRLQVLPLEGDQDSWPLLLGRTLFEIFGGNHPAIRTLYLTNEHDQIPDDIVECWATCYWSLHACLTAPLSAREHKRITQYLRPLAELACRLTLPTKEELLGDDVMTVMVAMSENYGARLGVDTAAITAGHRVLVNALFKDSAKAPQAATA